MAKSKKPERKAKSPNEADATEADTTKVDAGSEPQSDSKTAGNGVSASLGAFIRGQREMANLSLRQLSAMTEISNAYLSQIERDLHEPSIRILKNVGRALGISPEVLLSRAGLVDADDDQQNPPATVSTEDAIESDPHLSAEEKQALLTVYRSYRSARG